MQLHPTLIQKHPHMRGEDYRIKITEFESARNTPTCVGKTLNDH